MTKRSVVLHASRTLVTLPCPPDFGSISGSCPTKLEPGVTLTSEAKDFHKQANYTYTVTGGVIVGKGSEVTWDLNGFGAGYYMATVQVTDSKKKAAVSSVTVTVAACSDCVDHIGGGGCPTMTVTCYDKVKAGTDITCRVDVMGSRTQNAIAYKWSARTSNGLDLSETIKTNGRYASIPTNGLGGHLVYTKVDVPGIDPSCNSQAEGSTRVEP